MSNYIIVTIVVIVVTCVTIVLKLSARWAHRKKKNIKQMFFSSLPADLWYNQLQFMCSRRQ